MISSLHGLQVVLEPRDHGAGGGITHRDDATANGSRGGDLRALLRRHQHVVQRPLTHLPEVVQPVSHDGGQLPGASRQQSGAGRGGGRQLRREVVGQPAVAQREGGAAATRGARAALHAEEGLGPTS